MFLLAHVSLDTVLFVVRGVVRELFGSAAAVGR